MWWVITTKPLEEPQTDDPRRAAVELENDALAGYLERDPADLEGALVAEAEELIELQLGTPGQAGSYKLVFSNRGASLRSMLMGDYFTHQDVENGAHEDEAHWVPLLTAVTTPDGPADSLALSAGEAAKKWLFEPLESVLWQHRLLEDGRGIEFTYAPGTGLVFRKRLEVAPGEYDLNFTFEVQNVDAPEAKGVKQFRFTPAGAVLPTDETSRFYQEPQSLAVWAESNGAYELDNAVQKTGGEDIQGAFPKPANSTWAFAGVHNKFFAFLASPADPKAPSAVIGANYRRVMDEDWLAANPEEDRGEAWKLISCDLDIQVVFPEVGGTSSLGFKLFAGPKQRQVLERSNPAFGELLDDDIGMFSGISKIITAILAFYQGLVGNWGWAIVLMTLTVRGLLFPLNRRAQTSMARFAKKMKRVQPMLDANKEKYADDQKKQREEQAKIMQREGAFPPVGGCAPMLLQFPIFIGLFQALRVHFDLRHEPFILWMKDLSQPDQLARIDFQAWLPLKGSFTIEYLNILPLIMIVLWIGQHKAMPQPETNDPKQAQTRKLMMGMQVFFAFLFYNYASGLALYMITSSGLAIFESLVIKRVWPLDDTEQEKKKPGKFMKKIAEVQKEQQRRMEQEQQKRGSKYNPKKGKKR